MLILGLSAPGRGGAAALLKDGVVIAAVEEEKLAGYRWSGAVAAAAVAQCLEQCGMRPDMVDIVGAADRTPTVPPSVGALEGAEAEERRRLLGRLMPTARLECFDSDLTHAASAFYGSPFDDAAVLTLDASGPSPSGLVAVGAGGQLTPVRQFPVADWLGDVHAGVSKLLGFEPTIDDRKIQWLGKEGVPEFLDAFRRQLTWNDGWPSVMDGATQAGSPADGALSAPFLQELGLTAGGACPSAAHGAAIARTMQCFLEEVVVAIAERVRKLTGQRHLCVAGSTFLNALLVYALEHGTGFDAVFAQPAAGNAGTAVGAAHLAWIGVTGQAPSRQLAPPCLGPEFSEQQVKAILDNCKIIYRYYPSEDNLLAEVIGLLLNDKTIAWYRGRLEFGPRALGNRTIVASPFCPYVIPNLNHYIKHRDSYHPFALAVPAERADEYFEYTDNARFMTSVGRLKADLPDLAPFSFDAGRVRVHLVSRSDNLPFWRLLTAFGARAPAPILVNTSFNLFGEPLVCDPRAAVRSFSCAGLDAMAIERFLITK